MLNKKGDLFGTSEFFFLMQKKKKIIFSKFN